MDLAFDFDFRARHLRGDAGRAVEQIWYARGTVPYRSEHIAPTGSSVALLILGDPITDTSATGIAITSAQGLVIGPHTAPVVNAPHGETFALGIVARATGCEATFGRRPAGLRGRVVDLGEADTRLATLRDGLAAMAGRGADPESMLDRVADHLQDTIRVDIAGLARIEEAVAALIDDPRRPIADVATAVGLSHAHLDREFARIVGLRPRELARLLHLRRIVDAIDPLEPVSWAGIAADGGWADQAHLSRDFKRHTGLSPRRYLAVQRAFAESGAAAAGFSPDIPDPR